MDYFIRKIARKQLREVLLSEVNKTIYLYHGSPYVFEKFKNQTVFFTDNENFAIDYSEDKSFAGAMDEEPKLYKVKVHTNIFDIKDESDYKKLASVLPDEVEFVYNNFGFRATTDKEDMLLRMRGLIAIRAYEPAVNANIGDKVPDPNYDREHYIITRKEGQYAFGISNSNYKRITKDLIDYVSTPFFEGHKEIVENFQNGVKDIFKKDLNKMYVSRENIRDAVFDAFSNSYRLTELSDEFLEKVRELYKKAESEIKSSLFTKKLKYEKGFPIEDVIEKTGDTWRYYENEIVYSLIKKLGYGGYVAQEKGVDTYAIFNPGRDVEIVEYQIPVGKKFSSWNDYKSYLVYDRKVGEMISDEYWINDRRAIYNFYKSGISADDAAEQMNKNAERYLFRKSS